MAKRKLRRLHSHHPHRRPRHVRKLIEYYDLPLKARDSLFSVRMLAGTQIAQFGPPMSHQQIVYWAIDSYLPTPPTHDGSRAMSEFQLGDQGSMMAFLTNVEAAIVNAGQGYSVNWVMQPPQLYIALSKGNLQQVRDTVSKSVKP
jgi:hypothetical protein